MASAQTLKCPGCGEPILRTDDRCLSCGAHLDEGHLVGTPSGQPAPPVAAAADVLEIDLEPEEAPASGRQRGPATQRPRVPAPAQRPAPTGRVPYRVLPDAPAWHPLNAPPNQGFFACLTRAWCFLNQALSLAAQNLMLVAPSLLAFATGLVLVVLFIVVMPPTRMHTAGVGPHEHYSLLFYAVAGSLSFVIWLATYWFAGLTAHMVSAVLHGRQPLLAEAWNCNCRNAMALVWLSLISMAVQSGRRRSRDLGLLASLAGGVAETTWRAASYLLVPIIVLEGLPLSRAFGRAIDLHRGNVINVIVGEVAVSWLTSAISFIVIVGAAAGLFFAYQVAPAALPLLIIGWAAVVMVAGGFAAYIRTAYYTCLYEWTVAWEQAGEAVPAPLPLAAAFSAA